MAEVLTGTAAAATSAVGTSVTVTLAGAPVSGEKLIAIVGHSDDYPNVPAGWTQVDEAIVTGVTRMFTKTSDGTEGTSLVFTAPTSGSMAARVLRYTGLGVVHSDASNSSEGTNQTNFGNLTTTNPDTFVVAGTELHSSTLPASDCTWNSSFTPVAADIKSSAGTKRSQLAVASRTLTSATTLSGVAAAYTPSTTTNNQGVMVAFLFASSALDINAGTDQAIFTTQTATLNSTASGGAGGNSFLWTKDSGPAGTFASATSEDTTFTPTGGAGTYVLRCTVTDSSTATDFDTVTITVAIAPVMVYFTHVNSSTGWTPTGGTLLEVLSDSSLSTLMTSTDTPVAVTFDGSLAPCSTPEEGQGVTATLSARRVSGSSGTITAALYEGATLISTSAPVTLPTTLSSQNVTIVFPAADVEDVDEDSWATVVGGSGADEYTAMRVTLAVTAA